MGFAGGPEKLSPSSCPKIRWPHAGHATLAIDAAIEKIERIKLLVQPRLGYEGYSMDAAWGDTKLGLRHWSGFSRAAIVTDLGWIRNAFKAMSFMMPCLSRFHI